MEEVAEALVKSYAYALAKGLDKVMPSEIDAKDYYPEGLKYSCLIDVDGRKRPSFYAYKTLIAKIDGFTEAEVISDEPFLAEFKLDDKVVYVAWGEGKLPLEGHARLTDMYGEPLGEVDLSEYELEGELVYIELTGPTPGEATQPPPAEEAESPLIAEALQQPLIALLVVVLVGLAIGLAWYVVKGRAKTAATSPRRGTSH